MAYLPPTVSLTELWVSDAIDILELPRPTDAVSLTELQGLLHQLDVIFPAGNESDVPSPHRLVVRAMQAITTSAQCHLHRVN